MKKWNIENLKALRIQYDGSKSFGAYQAYINGLEFELAKALEQPAQDPVAWMYERDNGAAILEFYGDLDFKGMKVKPLYTHPAPSWQGLSDDEINDIVNKIRDDMYPWKDGMLVGKVARAIEQALKEKNGR